MFWITPSHKPMELETNYTIRRESETHGLMGYAVQMKDKTLSRGTVQRDRLSGSDEGQYGGKSRGCDWRAVLVHTVEMRKRIREESIFVVFSVVFGGVFREISKNF